MVCLITVYRCTLFMFFKLEFSGIVNQGQGCYEGNVRSEVRFSEVLPLLHFSGYYLFSIIDVPSISWIRILRHIPFFKLTSEYLSTSYRRNTKVQIEQKSYRSFRRIDSSKLVYRLTINTI
jgi:hypothetical protein